MVGVVVGANLRAARRSRRTGVLWRGFVGQLCQSSLELSADVLVETWDLNVQLRPFLFLLLFFALTAMYEHSSIGESLLMLIGHG